MNYFKFHTTTYNDSILNKREGEIKLGEVLSFCNSLEDLANTSARYIIFGISESIGVQANFGKKGTEKAWDDFVKAYVNTQENEYNSGKDVVILGHFDFSDIEKNELKNSVTDLSTLVQHIDKNVRQLVEKIIAAGKIPVMIGGGHNNAYGILSGVHRALEKPINCLNIDAHTDLRTTDRRHSGNPFSYAIQEAALHKYHVFGLHKNYTPQYIFKAIKEQPQITFDFYDTMLTSKEQTENYQTALAKISTDTFGLELDCDAIAHFNSSARSPSGFSIAFIRNAIRAAARTKTICYFHCCEAIPSAEEPGQIGKALSFFITDFINTHREYHSL